MDDLKLFLKEYLIEHGFEKASENIGLYLFFLTILITSIIPTVYNYTKKILKFFKQKKAIKDLHPFYLPNEVKAATDFYINTKCQNVPPSDVEELISNHAVAVQDKLLSFFLKKVFTFKINNDNRFYFVLSDSGMGKTTFLINLFIKYSNKNKNDFKIKLFPLGYKNIDSEIKRISTDEKRQTILLLDAFDEDVRASQDCKQRLNDIVNLVWDFRFVVITSRTQFFTNEDVQLSKTNIMKFGGDKGFHSFQKIYISPFDNKDINKYLKRKFSILKYKKRRKGYKIVTNCQNLMVRPMLLSYIEDLLSSNSKIKNASQSYEALINKWIEREANRLDKDRQYSFKKELRKFSNQLAVDIYKNREKRGGLYITSEEMLIFAKRNKISLKDIEMKSRSLLNRHSSGYYKFAHRSILEYLIAKRLIENKNSIKRVDFKVYDQAYKFYLEIFWNNVKGMKIKDWTDLSHKLLDKIENIPNLKNLKYIELKNNSITDISPLSSCKALIGLDISHNKVLDLSALKDLQNLQFLFLRGNKITDISVIKELKNLRQVDLTSNPLNEEYIESLRHELTETDIIYRK